MPISVTHYRVFIASPSGLSEERKAFRDTLNRYGARDGLSRGIFFDAVGWEMTLGQQGRPQAIINEEVRSCDFFVLLLHDRWGTSPGSGTFTSGTEEELSVAMECLAEPAHQMQNIVIAFKSVSERQLADPGPELSKVLDFRKGLERDKKFLYHTFDDVTVFTDTLDRHLAQWARTHEDRKRAGVSVQTSTAPVPTTPVPPVFDPALRKAEILSGIDQAETLLRDGKVVEAELAFSGLVAKFDDGLALARFGRFLRKTGNRHRATDMLTKALELCKQMGDRETQAYAIRQLGKLRELNGETTGAIAQYGDALSILRSIPDLKGEARALRDLALANRKIGNAPKAIEYLLRAKDIAEELHDENSIAATLGYLGVIYKSQGDFVQALSVNEQAIKIQDDRKDLRGAAAARSNLAIIYRMMGRSKEAQDLHEQSLKTYQQQGDRQGESRELSNLGTLQRTLGNVDEAIELHLRSLAIAEQLQNKHGIAIQYGNLARNYAEQGKLDEAERLHVDALNLSKSVDDIEGQAWQQEGLGHVHVLRGNLSQGRKYFESARSDFHRIGSKYGEAVCSDSLANVLRRLGRAGEAEAEAAAAKEFFQKQGIVAHPPAGAAKIRPDDTSTPEMPDT